MAQDDKNNLDLDHEMNRRVVYSLFLPVVRLAFVFRVPIKELGDWLHMAYYHETKRRGLKMREAAELLSVSMRKVALLSKRLKQNFIQAETDHELPRRIEFILWAGTLSEARLIQALPVEEPEAITAALQRLLEQGRVEEVPGRTVTYQVVRSTYRLVHDNLLARIDGLNNLLASTANAVYARFFRSDPRAFARTVSLRIRKRDEDALMALYRDVIWPKLVELDEAAKGDPEADTVDVSLVWAPYEYLRDEIAEGDEE